MSMTPYGTRKTRVMPSGLVLKYNKAAPRYGSARYRRRTGKLTGQLPKGAIAPFGGRRELKYVDLPPVAYQADNVGTVTLINGVALGDDNTQRDGRQANFKSVHIRGQLFPIDAQTSPSLCRLLLVWDNANNSAAAVPLLTQIMTFSGNAAFGFPVVDNSNRFTVLVDRTYGLGGTSTLVPAGGYVGPPISFGGNISFDVNIYKKLDCITQYSGINATIGSIQNGSLLMITVGSEATNNGGSFILSTRCRFTDP